MNSGLLLYIDPGTGSMLFAILIGILGAIGYVIRMAWVKIRFRLTSGKKAETMTEKKPFVIFSDDKRYWSVFEPVVREFDKRGKNVLYLTASSDDPALDSKYEHIECKFIGENNKAFSKLNFINATILLSTTPGLDVYQWKRSREVDCYVHMLHAAGEVSQYRMFGLDYYDAVIVAGDFQREQIRKLEKLRSLPEKEIVCGGIPYMDEMVRRLKESGPVSEHERTVLLAPSWGPSSIFNRFGGSVIDALLDTGYRIIVRPHPQSFTSEKELMDELMTKYPQSDRLEWNRDADNFEVLRRSDILISDFSGVVFDFSLVCDKPVIYTDTEFDRAPYDYWWLDDEVWTLTALPRLGMKLTKDNLSEVKSLIDECIGETKYAEGRNEVRNECWQLYGEGAKATVDYLVGKYERITKGEKK